MLVLQCHETCKVVFCGERRLVISSVLKGKQIQKIVKQRGRTAPIQKVKKIVYCILHLLLDFLHFHQSQHRSIPF